MWSAATPYSAACARTSPDRPLRIAQFNRIVILRPNPVAQLDRRNPMRVQPRRNIRPLITTDRCSYPPPGATITALFVGFDPGSHA